MTNFQQGSTSALILNENNQILFVKRSEDDEFLPGFWELPGGGIDYGESAEQCLIREIKEECGIDIKVIKPLAVGNYFIKDVQRIEICFLCKPKSMNIILSSEHSEYKWIDFEKISQIKITHYIEKILFDSFANI